MSGEAPPPAAAPASANEAAVGAVLDDIRTFRHNYWAPLLLGFIMLFDSWDSIAIAFAMPALAIEWKLDPMQMGLLISAGYGGQFLGAFSLGAIAERVGRMPVIIAAVALMCVLAIACAMAPGFNSMFVLRLLQGIMIGGALPVAITYINELAPTKTRGRYFGLYQTLAMSGFSIAALLSPFVIPYLGWRWMLGLGVIPIVLLPLVWITLPESPRWLARAGRLDAANKALAKLGGRAALFTNADEPAKTDTAPVAKPNLLSLFTPKLRGHTSVITALWFLTMFVSFGLTTWIPSIYVKVFNIPVERALNYSAMASIAIFICLAITGTLIDKYGRRPFALGGLIVTAIVLLWIPIFRPESELVLVALITTGKVAIFFGTFVLWPYTAETHATPVRALALGYASSIGRASSMLTPLFVGFVLARGASVNIVFAFFGLFALIAFILWIVRTRETVGKALDSV